MAALIGGGASLIGGMFGNKASAKQARQQMDFQERMSSTAHQREVADLRAAGLNPILSGTGGMGASTPSGAQAPQHDVITPAVSSAVQGARNAAEVKLLKQREKTEKETTRAAESEADILDFERRVVDYQRHIGGLNHERPVKGMPIGGVEAAARERYEASRSASTAAQLEREIDEGAGEFYRNLRRLGITGSTATEIFKMFSGGQRRQYTSPTPQRSRR